MDDTAKTLRGLIDYILSRVNNLNDGTLYTSDVEAIGSCLHAAAGDLMKAHSTLTYLTNKYNIS